MGPTAAASSATSDRSCLNCGAPAQVDGRTERIIHCEYCRESSYMPDALWLRLHPAKRKRPLFLLLDVTDKQKQRAYHAVY